MSGLRPIAMTHFASISGTDKLNYLLNSITPWKNFSIRMMWSFSYLYCNSRTTAEAKWRSFSESQHISSTEAQFQKLNIRQWKTIGLSIKNVENINKFTDKARLKKANTLWICTSPDEWETMEQACRDGEFLFLSLAFHDTALLQCIKHI